MTDAAARNCGECIHWTKMREQEGVCRRHAPDATRCSDEVAHWPQTHIRQVCGEGLVASVRPGASCAACLYWRHPAAGLEPVDRGDMPKAWWARAGLCVRSAPRPSAEPGPRAFWPATGHGDGCGDGVVRPDQPSPTKLDIS
jgi:hypothetical protein